MKIGITVEYTHEINGARKSETVEMTRPVGDRKAYTDEAFKRHIAERLEKELGVVQPEIVRYEHHGPPL
jgi:hypothetical protein